MLLVSTVARSQAGHVRLLLFGLLILASALGLEIWNRKKMQSLRFDQLRAKSEITLFQQSLTAHLLHPETCTNLWQGLVLKPGGATVVSAPAALQEWAKLHELEVPQVQWAVGAEEDMRTELSDHQGVGIALARHPAQLHMRFTDVEAKLPVFVWLRRSDLQVESCFSETSSARLCNDFGGYFVPRSEPYAMSCRFSLKAERRTDKGFVSRSHCRLGPLTSTAKACRSLFDLPFSASLLQEGIKELSPPLKSQYLCELCQ